MAPEIPLAPARPDIEAIRREAMDCTKCALSQGRTSVVWAKGNLDGDLLFIGEAPGFHEDKQGLPFVGAAGQLLDRLLDEVGISKQRAAVVNVLKCRPPGSRDPAGRQVRWRQHDRCDARRSTGRKGSPGLDPPTRARTRRDRTTRSLLD